MEPKLTFGLSFSYSWSKAATLANPRLQRTTSAMSRTAWAAMRRQCRMHSQ